MKEFTKYHPLVNFVYFFAVIGFSMVFMHPVTLTVSLVCGFTYSLMLAGKKALKFNLYMLPLLFATALINPLINHEGATILLYLPSGNPLTAESIVYGISAAAMLWSVISHFSCFNAVITSDKIIYLFGKISPSLSMIFSMVLRFVPNFKTQLKGIANAQISVGKGMSQGSIISRSKGGIEILSIMITKTFENAIDAADSMKSRGYGIGKRTSYSNYRLQKRDLAALLYIILLCMYIITGGIMRKLSFNYFPMVTTYTFSTFSISIFAAYLLLFTYPVIIEISEVIKWKKLKSKI